MLNPGTRLVVNTGEVAAKVMDGEAILINIANGFYYSMDGVGGFIWDLVERGHSLGQMEEAVIARYDVAPEQASKDIEKLAGALMEESLVSATDGSPPPTTPPPPAEKLPYAPPALAKYHDMSDLLALDPPMPGLAETPWQGPGDDPAPDARG